MKITLKKPFAFGSDHISELNFREELCAGDLRGVKLALAAEGDIGPLMTIAGRLCGKVDPVMSKLGLADTKQCTDYVNKLLADFFGNGAEADSSTEPSTPASPLTTP